jgi:hypothetical protein
LRTDTPSLSQGKECGDELFNTLVSCYFSRMKNITITLDEQTAARARRHAARLGLSLSRYVGQVIEKSLRESRDYERAMRRFFARHSQARYKSEAPYPKREELYDRGRLR